MRLLLSLMLLMINSIIYGQCVGTVRLLNATSPNEIYRPASAATWQPNDTIKIVPTYLTVLEIYGDVGGTYDCPVVIMANTTLNVDVIRFKGGAHNFKVISTGSGKDTNSVRNIVAKNVGCDQADHIEFNGLKIRGSNIGFYNKMNVSYADQNSWFPNFYQTGNKLIGCWISQIDGEGVYSGLTQPNGYTVKSTWSGLDTNIVGNITDSTVIMDCYVNSTTWDGIQLSHSGYGNIVANNIVEDFGTLDLPGQKAGIIMGGDCNGDVYGNIVRRGKGNGIQVFGFASINVYNNTVEDVGNTASNPQGEESIYCVSHPTYYTTRPPLALNIHDNQINYPKTRGAIALYTNSADVGALVVNNKFCINDAPANWQSIYLKINIAGSTNSNNTLYCPSNAGCGCVISNILRGKMKYSN